MLKKLWEWIKRPRGWKLIPVYLLTAVFIAGAVALSILGQDTGYEVLAYVFYALAALSLGYTVYTLVLFVPAIKSKITEKLKSHTITANVLENYDFKTTVFALLSFAVTVAFATVNLVSAIKYGLIWYGAIAAYYFVLILFRGGVLFAYKKCAGKFSRDTERYERSKWQIYLASGVFLILLAFAMTGAVTQMMLSGRPAVGGEIMAITNAAYTFYKIGMAVYNLFKARKSSNPVTQALRNLNFADACMSVVSLTVLMISTFENGNTLSAIHYVKYAVGFFVCAAIIAMASFMIIKADKKRKETDKQKDSDCEER